MSRIGLYYPYIHFMCEDWLRVAALYWANMSRIVPRGYELHDSPTVERLKGELGFIKDLDPMPAASRIAPTFLELLEEHGPALLRHYEPGDEIPGLTGDTWTSNLMPAASLYHPDGFSVRRLDLSYVAAGKVEARLLDAMVQTGLVIHDRHAWRGSEWLAMHPRLAEVYMTALAGEMATANHLVLQPVRPAVRR